jgi:hypothetical protein
MLPRHYLVADPSKRIQAYIGDYLQQEIVEEAIVRQLDVLLKGRKNGMLFFSARVPHFFI